MQQAGTTIKNNWAAVGGSGGDNHNSWGEDGGWSQGPKVTGSGWKDTGLSENNQDIGTWQNPKRSDQNWNQKTNSVIVDSTDKEAWPSIRPGQTVSDSCDDISNSLTKSGSVISSSINQGQIIDITKVSSAMQSQSASTPWGATSTFGGIQSNPWGSGNSPSPSAANQSAIGWGSSSNPHPSLSVNNQGHNMQSGISLSGSDITNIKTPSIGSLGWGSSTQGLGVHRPQNSMQLPTSNGNNVHGLLPNVSGAQHSGPSISSTNIDSNPWPSNSFGDLTGFSKTSESGWNNSNAVMNNGASDKIDINPNEPNVEHGSSVWGKSSGFGASGWDQTAGNIKPPVSGSQFDNENAKSQWGDNPSGAAKSQGSGNNTEHLSWAQAACKGLPPRPPNAESKIQDPQISQERAEITRVIDSHEGWGRKPVCQNQAWDSELAKTAQIPRVDDGAAENMWDNSNGTAIWEASRETQKKIQSGWNGATSGPQWNKDKEPHQWNGQGISAENNPIGAGGPDGSIGNWNVPDSANANVWGTKTETGSWKDTSSWEDPRQQDGTVHWSGEMVKPKSWSSTPSTPSTPITPGLIQKEDWNKGGGGGGGGFNPGGAPGSNRPGGWGNPGNDFIEDRVDDGTSIWAGNAQQQARASGWGDTGTQWNPTVGAKNKTSWGEADNWNSANRKQDWTDDQGGWGSVDVGYWSDISQENTSWNSASGWKNKQLNMVKIPTSKFPPSGGGFHPQNQMRVRLLEQLISMGFKKEDAQNALISNNMNYEGALAELQMNGVKKDNDMDMFNAKGKNSILPDGGLNDISENQLESNPHVPNFPMQNTPLQNAQVPNQPFMSMYDRSKLDASLPTSSPNPMNSSINPALQPKFMPPQKLQQMQQAPSLSPTQGPLPRSQVPGQTPGQNVPMPHLDMAHQQVLQQLRIAVQSGLISPHLLSQQLPRNILLLLQQLLTCQNYLQQLITKQTMINKNKIAMQPVERQQLPPMINQLKQQILNIQKQISQAQAQLKQPTQLQNPDMDSLIPPLQSELNNLSINSSAVNSQTQSRLTTQWKSGEIDIDNLNKAVGSKPMHQSLSSPNLGRFDDLSSLNISGDTTWSTNATTTSQNWPTTSAEGTTSHGVGKDSSDIKESLNLTTLNDVIPEFVPGKPWQGFSNKNVEDDPHITPGSYSRSYSVNYVKDDYLDNLSQKNPNSSSADWGKGTNSKIWSLPGESGPTDWSGGLSSGRQPPGMSLHGNRATNWQRQNSWAGRTENSFNPVNDWEKSQKYNKIIIKNISQQTDQSILKTLCLQHGPLNGFVLLPHLGLAIVCYASKEEAAKAQRALNSIVIHNSTIIADFISDEDANRLSASAMNPTSSQWSQIQPQQQVSQPYAANSGLSWSTAPTSYLPTSAGSGNMWSSGLWGGATDDHNSNPLVNNILGGQSM